MSERVLVVDDDPTIVRTLRINLRARGLEVEGVSTGADALASLAEEPADLVILDLGLPDIDGVDVLRRIRATSTVPVVVLSARQEADDKVEALDEGADDYVTKPFGMDELMARVRAAIRRGAVDLPGVPALVTADFALDFDTRTATVHGTVVRLTPTEWRLLDTWPGTRERSCRMTCCSSRRGDRPTGGSRTTSVSMPTSCAASSSRTRVPLATSSPSPASDTACSSR